MDGTGRGAGKFSGNPFRHNLFFLQAILTHLPGDGIPHQPFKKGSIMRNLLLRFLISLTPVMLFAQDIFAQAEKKAQSPLGGLGSMLPMLIFMFLIIYFLMIRPEQRKQKERQKLLAAIKKGDRVMTAAGIFGTVGNVKDATVMVKIAENTVVEFSKNAITSVLNNDGTEKTPEKTEKIEKDDKEKK
jgi:preprotein translocase subunit YajC